MGKLPLPYYFVPSCSRVSAAHPRHMVARRSLIVATGLGALADFRAADCGEPCVAEAGDAESRLGRAQEAVNDYLAAHAVTRLAAAVERLVREGRFDDAI